MKFKFKAQDFDILCGVEDRYRKLDTDQVDYVDRSVLAAEIATLHLSKLLDPIRKGAICLIEHSRECADDFDRALTYEQCCTNLKFLLGIA